MNIEDVVELSVKTKFNTTQIIYLLYAEEGLEFNAPITKNEIGELKLSGLLDKYYNPTKQWVLLRSDKVQRKISFYAMPELDEIVITISNILSISNIRKTLRSAVEKSFFNNEELANFYYTWLYLFPSTAMSESNETWEKLFQVKYTGVQIRKNTSSAMSNFKRLARKKDFDMSLYIIATFLYIKSQIHNGKPYIKKMSSFFEEQLDWYEQAKDLLEEHGPEYFLKTIQYKYEIDFSESFQEIFNQLHGLVNLKENDLAAYTTLTKLLNANPELIPFTETIIGLFPSSEHQTNKGWEYLYGIAFNETSRREVSKEVINHLKGLFIKKDFKPEIYIMSVYLYVKSSIKEGKSFVKSISNFFKSEDEWYDKAEIEIKGKSKKQIITLFERDESVVKPGEKEIVSNKKMI